MNANINILIAEDQGIILGALSALLALEGDFDVVAVAADGTAALELTRKHRPDIVLTDIEMPNMTGIELAQAIQKENLGCHVVVLTTFARAGFLQRAMQAGVKGYLLKDAPSDELVHALRRVMAGSKVIDPELVMEAWQESDPLTEKERQALRLVAEGVKTELIAEKLHLSHGTVRNYLSNAVAKLHASNSVEAARIARQKGWL